MNADAVILKTKIAYDIRLCVPNR